MVNGRLCIAMFHPAAGLRDPRRKEELKADFKKIPLIIAEAERRAAERKPKAPEPPPQNELPPEQLSLF